MAKATTFVVIIPTVPWWGGDGNLYETYRKAHAAAKYWLDTHPGYTWEDLDIEEWEIL